MNESELMSKLLKTEAPVTFMGKDVTMKALDYKDDLILTAVITELELNLSNNDISDTRAKLVAKNYAAILVTMKLSLYYKEEKSIRPVFKTVDDVFRAASDVAQMTELLALHRLYTETMELTAAEKKS